MSDEPGEEEGQKKLSASLEGTSNISAKITAGYSAKDIQERLETDQIPLALILTSTRLEQVLGHAIANRYDISHDQFRKLYGNRSLGRYQDMTAILDLFEEHQETLQDMVSYRNNLVHLEPYGYLKQLEEDDAEREEVKETIIAAIELIEEAER